MDPGKILVKLTELPRSIIHLSVITATIPRINAFIAEVQTRGAGLAMTQRAYESYKQSQSGGKGDSGLRPGLRSATVGGDRSGKWNRSRKREAPGMLDSLRPDQQADLSNNFGGNKATEEIELDNRDQVETSSQSSLRGNAVYTKTEFRWVSGLYHALRRGCSCFCGALLTALLGRRRRSTKVKAIHREHSTHPQGSSPDSIHCNE